MKVSQFKQLIKEAVREVVREEMNDLRTTLMEQIKILQPYQKVGGSTNIGINKIPQSSITNKPSPYINTGLPINENIYQTTGDPLIDLLNETKYSNTAEDWKQFGGFDSSNAQEYIHDNYGTTQTQVGTVGDMLQSAPKTNDINQISIDVVPDFSNLMGAMKDKGII